MSTVNIRDPSMRLRALVYSVLLSLIATTAFSVPRQGDVSYGDAVYADDELYVSDDWGTLDVEEALLAAGSTSNARSREMDEDHAAIFGQSLETEQEKDYSSNWSRGDQSQFPDGSRTVSEDFEDDELFDGEEWEVEEAEGDEEVRPYGFSFVPKSEHIEDDFSEDQGLDADGWAEKSGEEVEEPYPASHEFLQRDEDGEYDLDGEEAFNNNGWVAILGAEVVDVHVSGQSLTPQEGHFAQDFTDDESLEEDEWDANLKDEREEAKLVGQSIVPPREHFDDSDEGTHTDLEDEWDANLKDEHEEAKLVGQSIVPPREHFDDSDEGAHTELDDSFTDDTDLDLEDRVDVVHHGDEIGGGAVSDDNTWHPNPGQETFEDDSLVDEAYLDPEDHVELIDFEEVDKDIPFDEEAYRESVEGLRASMGTSKDISQRDSRTGKVSATGRAIEEGEEGRREHYKPFEEPATKLRGMERDDMGYGPDESDGLDEEFYHTHARQNEAALDELMRTGDMSDVDRNYIWDDTDRGRNVEVQGQSVLSRHDELLDEHIIEMDDFEEHGPMPPLAGLNEDILLTGQSVHVPDEGGEDTHYDDDMLEDTDSPSWDEIDRQNLIRKEADVADLFEESLKALHV